MRKKSKSRKSILSKAKSNASPFKRLESGIPGLDTLLCGGFLEGGTYLLLGQPGAGKTIFANQLSFHQSARGRKALYVTLMAENHGRMFGHLETLAFFDRSRISDTIQYVSGYAALEKDGLDGLMKLLGALVHRYRANVLFLDGVASADELSGSTIDFKRFVHNLNSVLGLNSCTTFLLSSSTGDSSRAEYTMVDGIVHLRIEQFQMQIAREIEVTKFRGSSHLFGRHFFEINDSGLIVYPRVDSLLGLDSTPPAEINHQFKTGTPGLDEMIGGGLPQGSVTALLGPTGAGKTSIGMRFLEEGAREGEQGFFLSFYEHPTRLERKLAKIGVRVSTYFKNGKIEIARFRPTEILLDKILYEALKRATETKTKRVFIDGLNGLKQRGILGSERVHHAVKAFLAELRHLGATVIFVEETGDQLECEYEMLSYDSAITDNTLVFRAVHLHDSQRTIIQALKTRESEHDARCFELHITPEGPALGSAVKFVRPIYPVVEFAGQSVAPKPIAKRRQRK